MSGIFLLGYPAFKDGLSSFNLSNPSSTAYLNLMHSINPAASLNPSASIPTLNADGYPTGALASAIQSVGGSTDSTYYGRYLIWWTGNGNIQFNQPVLVYSGGQATSLGTSAGAITFNSNFGGSVSSQQPTEAAPVEWAFGSLISAVGTNGGLVEFTITLNSFSSAAFGTSPTTSANASISGDGTTATVTTSAPHNFPVGLVLQLAIAGATPSGFNGSKFCTITGASTFTYLSATSGSASAAGTWAPIVAKYQFNNQTGLPTGPNSDGSWLCYCSANNKLVVSGSSAYAGSVSITGTGGPGVQTEAILGLNSISTLTTTLNGTSGSFTAYTWSNAFWVKKANQSAAIAGMLATPEWKAQVKALNPWAFRTMDFQAVQSDCSVDWAHRSLVSNLSWGGTNRFVFDYYSGTATNNGSDGYTPASNPSSSPASGPPVDGEVIGCFISGANTGYAPTLTPNRSGGTAALIYPPWGGNGPLYCKGITATGTIPSPPTGHVITFNFSGAGLVGTYSPTYTMVSGDTTLSALHSNINNALRSNATLKAAGIIVPFWGFVGNSQNTGVIFQFNRNNGGLGASDLTITASDDAGALTYTAGVNVPGTLKNNTYYHFTYSAIMGGWIPCEKGDHKGPPIEFYAEIANNATCGVYHCIGHFWSQDRIYQTVLKFGQLGVKRLILECGNEEWNPFEAMFYSSQILGCCLGFSNVSSTKGSASAWTAIRTILISKVARQAWSDAGRTASDLFIVMPFQVDAFSATASSTDCNILLKGSDTDNPMNCSGTGTKQNPTLAAFGGFGATALTADFTSYPNRPCDYIDAPSHAPYWNGMQLNVQQNNAGFPTSGKTATSYSGLLLAAYNYANGNSTQQAAALDFLYDGTNGDLYNGTINTGNDNTHRLGSLVSGSGVSPANGYFSAATMCGVIEASGDRAPLVASNQVSQLLLGYIPYEGGPGIGPTLAQGDINAVVTSLNALSGYSAGYTSSLPGAASGPSSTAATDAQNVANLWEAFKADNRFYLLYTRFLTECRAAGNGGGTRNNVSIPMQFQLIGTNSPWEIFKTDIGAVTVPYTAVQAMIDFNN